MIKWMCKTCGSVHEGSDALKILLASAFTPVEVQEKPKEIPKPVKPIKKEEPEFEEESEEMEDLRI
jgi:hypothetical protein